MGRVGGPWQAGASLTLTFPPPWRQAGPGKPPALLRYEAGSKPPPCRGRFSGGSPPRQPSVSRLSAPSHAVPRGPQPCPQMTREPLPPELGGLAPFCLWQTPQAGLHILNSFKIAQLAFWRLISSLMSARLSCLSCNLFLSMDWWRWSTCWEPKAKAAPRGARGDAPPASGESPGMLSAALGFQL